MPEHDLLMQLNRDMKTVCAAISRIEQKVDGVIQAQSSQCEEYDILDGRVTALEHKDIYRTGIAGGIALVVSWVVGWIK